MTQGESYFIRINQLKLVATFLEQFEDKYLFELEDKSRVIVTYKEIEM